MNEWLENYLEQKKEYLTTASDFIWDHPEIRFEEIESSRKIIELLKENGFEVEENLAGIATAFSGTFGTGGPVIAFLGEYDALADLSQTADLAKKEPLIEGGYGHGCGHNLLGIGALGAALALKAYLEEHQIPGTVRYYGCPAEEGGSGKTFMAREGAFEDVDLALTWHPSPVTGVWTFSTLANIQAYFRFKGKSAHAAAAPHLGRSALDAVELMNVGVNYLREHMIDGARIHYAITDTGGASPNVVQANAEVLHLIRAPHIDDVKALYERVKKIAEGAALMTETEVEIVFDKACSNFIPLSTVNEVLQEALQEVTPIQYTNEELSFAKEIQQTLSKEELSTDSLGLGKLNIPTDQPLFGHPLPLIKISKAMPGSTDVGDVSWVAPTGQVVVTTCALGTGFHTWQLVAQGKSSYAHKGMLQVSKILSVAALKFIQNPTLLQKAKEEHREQIGESGYDCPIPKEIKPNQNH